MNKHRLGRAYFQTFLPTSPCLFGSFFCHNYSHIALQQKPNKNIFGKPRNLAAAFLGSEI